MSLPLRFIVLTMLADVYSVWVAEHRDGPLVQAIMFWGVAASALAACWLVLAAGHLLLESTDTRRRIRAQKESS